MYNAKQKTIIELKNDSISFLKIKFHEFNQKHNDLNRIEKAIATLILLVFMKPFYYEIGLRSMDHLNAQGVDSILLLMLAWPFEMPVHFYFFAFIFGMIALAIVKNISDVLKKHNDNDKRGI